MINQRQNTTSSLQSAGVLFDELFMNDIGSSPEQQLEFKKFTVAKFADRVAMAFDDNPKAKKIYADLGVKKIS